MKSIATMFRPADATVADLEAQLDAMRAVVADATASIDAAVTAFDLDPSSSNEKALLGARAAAAGASEHVGRAERLLAAARARDAQAERDQLEAELAGLETKLEHEALQRLARPLDEREIDLMIAIVQVRAERQRTERELSDVASAADRIRTKLGRPQSGRQNFVLASRHGIVDGFRRQPWDGDIERRLAADLAREVGL